MNHSIDFKAGDKVRAKQAFWSVACGTVPIGAIGQISAAEAPCEQPGRLFVAWASVQGVPVTPVDECEGSIEMYEYYAPPETPDKD